MFEGEAGQGLQLREAIFFELHRVVIVEIVDADDRMPLGDQAFGKVESVMVDLTRQFNVNEEKDAEIKEIMTTVYHALEEKGYNPINQIVGYILSEDPTYITNHNNARSLIRRIDRDELLQILVKSYLDS